MLGITDLKKGKLIVLEDEPFKVVEYAQKQKGRGGSIVNVKVKNLLDGSVRQQTFQGNDQIEPADVENRKVQFLYADDLLHFMNQQTFEQFTLDPKVLGETAALLKEGQECQAQFFNGTVINVELPIKIELEVAEAPDVVKGDTQSTVQKEVELETGARISAPIFIKSGDSIVVDTRDSSYVERVKE